MLGIEWIWIIGPTVSRNEDPKGLSLSQQWGGEQNSGDKMKAAPPDTTRAGALEKQATSRQEQALFHGQIGGWFESGTVGFIDWLDGLAAQTHKTNTINVDAYDQNNGDNEEGLPDPLSKSQ
jgi:hypothetical protein